MTHSMNFIPRTYQTKLLNFLSNGGKRAFVVWHRRAGKNMTAFQWLLSEALVNVGLYYYVFPSLKQGKKILWEGKTGAETENMKFIDYINPDWIWPDARLGINNTDMTVKLRHPQDRNKEGSLIQIVGTKSDGGKSEADHLRGTNPRGIIMDEYSEHNPVAWQILSPILVENGGWALFTMTPKGPNHAFKMYNNIKDDPIWYTEVLDVSVTLRDNGKPVVSEKAIDQERREGKDEGYIQQEYYCSWAGISKGSYYTTQLNLLHKDNRFKPDLYNPDLDCFTTWDIGHDDETVVLVGQCVGQHTYWIDGIKESQRDLQYFWNYLKEWSDGKGYRYAAHYMPWDFSVHEFAASQSRLNSATKMGMRNVKIAPKLSIDEGHSAVRRDFGNWWFDQVRIPWVIMDLGQYCAKWNEQQGVFEDTPARTTYKHTADAIRTYAVSNKVPSHDLVQKLSTKCDVISNIYEDYGTHRNSQRRDRERMYSNPALRVAAWDHAIT